MKPMKPTIACSMLALALGSYAAAPWAQNYPHKPIRMLVGFSPGGNADISARVVCAKLGQALGTSVVVENRAGAAGSVATQIVARANPDGYTLMWANTGAFTINRILQKNLPYDPDKDFVPIGQSLSFSNTLIARQDSPVSSLAQLIALAKEKPGYVNYGTQGIGSAGFLSGQLLQQMSGVKLSHVPYKGGSDVTTAILGGEIQLAFASTTLAASLRKRMKLLAVTAPTREPILPDIPTMEEAGLKGYDATFWFGLAAPAGTPNAIVNRLNALLRDAVTDPEVVKTVQRQAINPAPSTPEEFAARIRTDYAKWKRVLEGS